MIEKIDGVQDDVTEMRDMLRGADSRSGIVKDVNFLMNQNRILGAISNVLVGIIAAVLTNYLISLL
jgi:hypothetical protein